MRWYKVENALIITSFNIAMLYIYIPIFGGYMDGAPPICSYEHAPPCWAILIIFFTFFVGTGMTGKYMGDFVKYVFDTQIDDLNFMWGAAIVFGIISALLGDHLVNIFLLGLWLSGFFGFFLGIQGEASLSKEEENDPEDPDDDPDPGEDMPVAVKFRTEHRADFLF